jgi:hypothetical protein
MGFTEEILSLQNLLMERKSVIYNEEATKHSLIIPLIQVLGYDIHNPIEVKPEYVADFAKKKGEKVDYAIFKDGKPIFFIEAKSVGIKLGDHDAQLSRYFNATPNVKLGIITDGIKYKFFTDFEMKNIMDTTPFFELDFENVTNEDIDLLKMFCKECFNQSSLLHKAEELIYISKIVNKLKGLLQKPDDDFIRFLVKDFTKTKVTSVTIEKFKPYVNKAISGTITELSQELMTGDEAETTHHTKSIITTEDELKAYDQIKAILVDAQKDISNLSYKDTVSYFGIFNNNINGWFVRFIIDKDPMIVMVNMPYSILHSYHIEFKMQSLNSKGITKIFINNIDDIQNLKDIIVKAFEMVE